jgi:LmbE family N-acetylglucosaminyl deacetylase
MTIAHTFLGIFAHPDDEGSASGSLGQAAAAGHRVYVACATRGNGVDAKISDPALATPETLGEVRSQELACACAKLGLQPPVFLGYQDGDVDQLPLDEAAGAVARLMRELQPDIVITHGPEGGYGHPDHIAVSHFTTRAFELAGDPAVDLGLPPHAPAKLYYTALPRSYLHSVPAFRDRRADIRGQALGFVGVPDETITTEVSVAGWMTRKLEALSCHRTQFEFDPQTGQPKLFTTSLPEPQRTQLFGHERFVLARSRVPTTGRETSLLAGLAEGSQSMANAA